MKRTKKYNLNNMKDVKAAERMQERLYNEYDHVRLVMLNSCYGYFEYC